MTRTGGQHFIRNHDYVGDGPLCSRCFSTFERHIRGTENHAPFPRVMANGRPAKICGYEIDGRPCNRGIQFNVRQKQKSYWSHRGGRRQGVLPVR